MHSLTIRTPDDFHVHFRQGPAAFRYAMREAASFGRALAMPNLDPPLADAASIVSYRVGLEGAATGLSVIPSFKLLPGMGAATVDACARVVALVGKYYPVGATTNAQDGLKDPGEASEALREMERLNLVLSIHAEDPSAPALEREAAFLPTVELLVSRYPKLRIVVEHVSSAEGAAFVRRMPPRVGATLTAHHLLFTIDDMVGDRLDPYLYCKPVLKTRKDRDALVAAAVDGDGRFFLGSDSAPHPPERKLLPNPASGVYAAPSAMPLLTCLFEDLGALDRLEPFVSEYGARFYGLPGNPGTLTLAREDWVVPEKMDDVVPLGAGLTLRWRVAWRA